MKLKTVELKPFEDEPFRFIDGDGHPVGKIDLDLKDEQLVALYRLMLVTRRVDERAELLRRQNKVMFYASCAGQEACHVGSAYATGPNDWLYPSHREQGVFITRGQPLTEIFAHFMSKATDPAMGRQMSGHLGSTKLNLVFLSSPVSTQISQAFGTAYAQKYRKEKAATLCYFGEGGTSENDFLAGLNFAAVFHTPNVFFCTNNQFAISVPREFQSKTSTYSIKAKAYGFDGYRVDGNDVLAVYYSVKTAMDRARNGGGPTLIEAVTYRYAPHSSADDTSAYRPPGELEEWKEKRDPIKRMRLFLIGEAGLLSEKSDKELLDEVYRSVELAEQEADRVPFPPLGTFLDDVYAEPQPWILQEEKQEIENLYEADYEKEMKERLGGP